MQVRECSHVRNQHAVVAHLYTRRYKAPNHNASM